MDSHENLLLCESFSGNVIVYDVQNGEAVKNIFKFIFHVQKVFSPSSDLRVPLSPSWSLVRMTANHGNQNGDDKRAAEIKVGWMKVLFLWK